MRSIAATFALLLATTTPALVAETKSSFDLSIPLSLLAGADGAFTLTCDTSSEADTRRMISALQRKGSRGSWESHDDDGRVSASRRGDRFRLRVWEDGSKKFDLQMPWPVAECLFGGRNGETFEIAVASLKAAGGLRLVLEGELAEVGVSLQ